MTDRPSNPNHERWLAETWKMIETCATDIRSSNVTLSPEGCRALLGERNAHETPESQVMLYELLASARAELPDPDFVPDEDREIRLRSLRERIDAYLSVTDYMKLRSAAEPARELTLLDFGYAPGNYTFKCHDCGQEAVGDKRALRCETCAAQALRENRRGAVKAAVVTNECTHEFRPIDSSGQRVCIYCNVRQEKASAPAWDCACNELDCPYCANRNALNGSEAHNKGE